MYDWCVKKLEAACVLIAFLDVILVSQYLFAEKTLWVPALGILRFCTMASMIYVALRAYSFDQISRRQFGVTMAFAFGAVYWTLFLAVILKQSG